MVAEVNFNYVINQGNLSSFLSIFSSSIGGMLGTSLYVLSDMIVGEGLGTQGLAALNLSIQLLMYLLVGSLM